MWVQNLTTGGIKHIRHRGEMQKFEREIISDLENRLETTHDYSSARIDILKELADRGNITEFDTQKIGNLKENYFKAPLPETEDIATSLIEFRSISKAEREEALTTLQSVLKERLTLMPDSDYNTLLEIVEHSNALFQTTIQPFMILMLSAKAYWGVVGLLFSKKIFTEMLLKTKASITQVGIFKYGIKTLKQVNSLIKTLIKPKMLVLMSSTVVMTAATPLFLYFYLGGAQNDRLENRLPDFESKRLGGEISKAVDTAAETLEALGSEASTLAGSFLRGFLGENYLKFRDFVSGLLEQYNDRPGPHPQERTKPQRSPSAGPKLRSSSVRETVNSRRGK